MPYTTLISATELTSSVNQANVVILDCRAELTDTRADLPWLEPLLNAVADAAPLLISGDDSAFPTRVALLTQPPKPAKPPRAPAPPKAEAMAPPRTPSED